MPAAYALTSARICGPTAPCARSASIWFARNASVSRARDEASCPESASASGSSPGTSSAAMRAGPRMSCRRSPRSAAVTQPAPNATSASVLPGDVRDAEAVADDRHALARPLALARLSRPSPSGAGLKKRRRSRAVTAPESGVSPS